MSEEPSTADGRPPRQARGNGLAAPAWLALRDVDPRYAATLLEALREASVAAYVAPSGGVRGPYLDVHLPVTPTDRLWVDARLRTEAERVVADTMPGLVAALDDDAWAGIVAMFDAAEPAASSAGIPDPWPAAEDVTATTPAKDRGAPDPPVTKYDPFDDDHFEPPDPPRAPRAPTAIRYGWALLIGGLLALVVPVLIGYSLGSTIAVLAVLSALAGFATLIYQMKDSPPTDSGPDDGAVV
jgi:hypothetical protein